MTFMLERAGAAVAVRSHVALPNIALPALGYVHKMKIEDGCLVAAAAGARGVLMTPAGFD